MMVAVMPPEKQDRPQLSSLWGDLGSASRLQGERERESERDGTRRPTVRSAGGVCRSRSRQTPCETYFLTKCNGWKEVHTAPRMNWGRLKFRSRAFLPIGTPAPISHSRKSHTTRRPHTARHRQGKARRGKLIRTTCLVSLATSTHQRYYP